MTLPYKELERICNKYETDYYRYSTQFSFMVDGIEIICISKIMDNVYIRKYLSFREFNYNYEKIIKNICKELRLELSKHIAEIRKFKPKN